jgi:Ca-activated chloride channel family protein
MINIEFTPEKDGILAGEANTFEVLLRASSELQQPSSSSKRLPLNLSLVIDRSGSMNGQPIEEAKKCAAMLVDRMNPNDQLSVVTYDSSVDVLFPTTKVLHKDRLKTLIDRIRTGGTTALYEGWSVGAEQVAMDAGENYLSRVLLLSDGMANHGLTDEAIIASHCQTMAENGVTTSTYGLGKRFNENLMTAMAKSGQGQANYGQTADDLMDPFNEEFDLMEAIIARRMKLRILPEVGVSFELLNGYTQDQEGRFIIPDLAYGADVWAFLKIKVSKSLCDQATDTSIRVLTATIDFVDDDGVERRTDPAVMTIELLAQDAFAELALDETVNQRSIELRAATLQEQAQIAARRDDWVRVDQIMEKLEALGTDNEWIKVSLERLKTYSVRRQRDEFSKEANYKTSRMRTRRVSRSEEEGSFDMSAERARPSYLRRKLEQGKKQL